MTAQWAMLNASGPVGLQHVSGAGGAWALHDAAASRAVEVAAMGRHAPHALMARAGLAVARLALALAAPRAAFGVLAGPGNNGGDGLIAARHLHAAGQAVQVMLLGDETRLPADALDALAQCRREGVAISDEWPTHASFWIDGLLGLGGRRAPSDALAEAIAKLNQTGQPILAIDLPSGLNPDTGIPLGEHAVRANATLSLLTLKPGLFTGQGRDLAGEVWFESLGETAGDGTARLIGEIRTQPRQHASHKGRYGDVAVVGGAPGMQGALWLAAHAALAAGAGRVYASPLDENAPLMDPSRLELMGRHAWWRSPPTVLAQTTVLCGCGAGDEVRHVLPALLSHAGRLVLDADGLNAIAGDPALQTLLRARSSRGLPTVLTPHPLEAARLVGTTVAAIQVDRLRAAQALAEANACVVVLKGSGTVVATPGQAPAINPTGNARLATAGTGDVLAGWLAGCWAQQIERPAAELAQQAVWLHGAAADAKGAATGAMLARDLIQAMQERRG